ncbi:FAD synthase-like [Saccostrea cucullata]|uniref:FAD synthase-like n=2 Tax=Saccostrea cuccullata TaxID=36930 RepID=UPI002ED5AB10
MEKAVRRASTLLKHIVTRHSLQMTSRDFTAGIIVIGDEILKGQTADTNSHFLCKHLFTLGVKVKKISVIGDDLEVIAKEVCEFSSRYTHVITSGGIGPTHDDLTFEGVAKAFNDVVSPHPDIVELCRQFWGAEDLSSPKMKLAMIPKSARLVYGVNKKTGEKNKFPLVVVNNVYIFPGVPSIMERSFIALEDLFKNPDAHFYTEEIFVQQDEVSIAAILNEVDQEFKLDVTLGSYPDFHNSYYKVKLMLESSKPEQIHKAIASLKEKLPEGSIVDYDSQPIKNATRRVYDVIESSNSDDHYRNCVKEAVSVLEECLEKYSLDEICIGFNGGKDCTVLLHIYYAVVKRKYPDFQGRLKALYIKSRLPFPEEEKFTQLSRDKYRLEMLHFEGRIKDSLQQLKDKHSDIKAVIMGTRITDPYSSHLQAFSMTDSDWPQFMRVNPVLNWSYRHIWKFLRDLNIPYCSLYDRGYTSLGSMNNTHPNPLLQYIDDHGVLRYKPAYTLSDPTKERDGRN